MKSDATTVTLYACHTAEGLAKACHEKRRTLVGAVSSGNAFSMPDGTPWRRAVRKDQG